MDSITTILTALGTAIAAGAAAGVSDTASQAIKDSYDKLKGLIQRRFAGKQEAEVALIQYEKKPEVWEMPLKDELIKVGADQDHEIVRAAAQLLAQANTQQNVGSVQQAIFNNAPVDQQTIAGSVGTLNVNPLKE